MTTFERNMRTDIQPGNVALICDDDYSQLHLILTACNDEGYFYCMDPGGHEWMYHWDAVKSVTCNMKLEIK